MSKSAFYDWQARDGGPTSRELDEALSTYELRVASTEYRRVYGARRLTAEVHDCGYEWTRKQVARLMHVDGIEGVGRTLHRTGKRGRAWTGPAPAPDRSPASSPSPSSTGSGSLASPNGPGGGCPYVVVKRRRAGRGCRGVGRG